MIYDVCLCISEVSSVKWVPHLSSTLFLFVFSSINHPALGDLWNLDLPWLSVPFASQVSGIFTAHPTPDLRVHVESGSSRVCPRVCPGSSCCWKLCFCWKLKPFMELPFGDGLTTSHLWKNEIVEDFWRCVELCCCFIDDFWLIVVMVLFFETMLMEELRSRTCGWISSWTNTESRQIQHNPPNLPGIQDQTQDVQCRSVQPVASGTCSCFSQQSTHFKGLSGHLRQMTKVD